MQYLSDNIFSNLCQNYEKKPESNCLTLLFIMFYFRVTSITSLFHKKKYLDHNIHIHEYLLGLVH